MNRKEFYFAPECEELGLCLETVIAVSRDETLPAPGDLPGQLI